MSLVLDPLRGLITTNWQSFNLNPVTEFREASQGEGSHTSLIRQKLLLCLVSLTSCRGGARPPEDAPEPALAIQTPDHVHRPGVAAATPGRLDLQITRGFTWDRRDTVLTMSLVLMSVTLSAADCAWKGAQ